METSFEVAIENEEVKDRASKKRRKSGEKEREALTFSEMPKDSQHIRHSVKHVRAEYYMTVDELMSVYHLSMEQAISAVITVGKRMFGLNWKKFEMYWSLGSDQWSLDSVYCKIDR